MDDNMMDNETMTTDQMVPSSNYSCDTSPTITFQYYTWGILANIISLIGIVCNILSIIVLQHRRMRNSTSYYLISLAVYDSIVLLSMSLFLALPTIYLEKEVLQDYYFSYLYMHPYVYPLALIAQTGTVYTTLAFTVERYIAVCRPLHAANTCTMSRTKRVIFLIFVCSVVYNLPRFLEYKTNEYWSYSLNKTLPRIEYTDIGRNKIFQEIYFIYAYLCIMFLLPFSLLTVLNILLIRAVNNARTVRDSITSTTSKETNLTVMLIVVINVFLGCQFPALVDNIVFAVFGRAELNCSVLYIQFTTISNVLVVINSAINFILYCLIGKRFRRVVIKIFYLDYLCPRRKNVPHFKYTGHHSSVYLRNENRVNGYNTNTRVCDVASSLL